MKLFQTIFPARPAAFEIPSDGARLKIKSGKG